MGAARTADGTACDAAGSGPAVVLVHGVGGSRADWEHQVPALATRFRVVCYDMLGHGESIKPPGPYRMDQFVEQINRLLDSLAIERAALVGLSMGGLVARAYALAEPGRSAALVILSSVHARDEAQRAAVLARAGRALREGPAANLEAAFERWFSPAFARAHPEALERVRTRAAANDPKAYAAAYRLFATADAPLVDSIRRIACPTLVATGAEDANSTPAMAERMAALIPGARATILAGLRHQVLLEGSEAVNRMLLDFLSGVGSASGDWPPLTGRISQRPV